MISKLAFALCLALAFFTIVVQAGPSYKSSPRNSHLDLNTNAKRFARGLPPLPPVKAKRRPTRIATAKRETASQVHLQTFTGTIKVLKGDGTFVGYISKTLTTTGVYNVVGTTTNAAAISFTGPSTGASSYLNIFDASNNRATTPYIGGAGLTDIGSGSANFVSIAGVSQTGPGAGPTVSTFHTTSSGNVESAIWKFDPSSNGISVQWVNASGSTPTSYIIYNPASSGGGLYIGGDISRYQLAHSLGYQVYFFLV